MLLRCRLLVFIVYWGWRCIRHVFFAFVILRCSLLNLRNWRLLDLFWDTSYWLSIVEINPFYLLRSRVCHNVSLCWSLQPISQRNFTLQDSRVKWRSLISWSYWSLISCWPSQVLPLTLPGILGLMKVICSISCFHQLILLLFQYCSMIR